MARKRVILLMTVGLGSDEESTLKRANRSAVSINHVRPDYIVFFATEESIKTIGFIKELIKDDYDEFVEGEDYEIVLIKDIDSFNECFKVYSDKLNEFWGKNKLIIDYTSGTKTMSASLASSAVMYDAQLITVGGYREEGFIKKGTESIRTHNVYVLKDRIFKYVIIKLFNKYRYDEAIDLLNYLISPDLDKDNLIKFIKIYSNWDNVRFEEAYDLFKEVDLSSLDFGDYDKIIKQNLKALARISNSHSENIKNCYILASLLNNAKRRAEEFKFDDGIARLYRSFELIGQIKLNQHGIESSNVDIDLLKKKEVSEEFIEYLENLRDSGKIRIGLVNDYLLLNDLGDKLGQYFVENRQLINNITIKRNNSVLAHGLDSHSKEDYDNFENLVLNLALDLDKDMKKFLKETKFPKFEV